MVENQVAAIADHTGANVILLSGGRNDGLRESTIKRCHVRCIAGLEYDDVTAQKSPNFHWDHDLQSRGRLLAKAIADELADAGCELDQTILHWHNHSLGKNAAAPIAIEVLASEYGFRTLLQLHDFAEDFRPENYVKLIHAAQASDTEPVNRYLYPINSMIRYATLTSGDADLLRHVGIPAAKIDVLPNGVQLPAGERPDATDALNKIRAAAQLPADSSWCVYPVRGIRRKNVGEFMLLSRWMPDNMYSGLTLPPTTPIERASYERWKHLGSKLAPRTVFDAGTFDGISFLDNLAASSFILSTSAAEGFGMAFLEPWLANRGVVARRLPHVTDDFGRAGVKLNRLYDAVWIPGSTEWIAECRKETQQIFDQAWQSLATRLDTTFALQWNDPPEHLSGQAIDFAQLTTNRQIEVLKRLSNDQGFDQATQTINSMLVESLQAPFDAITLRANRDQIATAYSLQTTADRLIQTYQQLTNQATAVDSVHNQQPDHNKSLVEAICHQRPFFPCRVETEIA